MDLLNQIITNTYTLPDLRHRIRLLRSFVEDAIFSNGRLIDKLEPEDQAWLKTLPQGFEKNFNTKSFYTEFKKLEEDSKKIIPLIVYLSFNAGPETAAQIAQYARRLFDPNLMVEIKLDPLILGGCALSWKGVYRDFSLRTVIDDKKQDILTSFKRYIH